MNAGSNSATRSAGLGDVDFSFDATRATDARPYDVDFSFDTTRVTDAKPYDVDFSFNATRAVDESELCQPTRKRQRCERQSPKVVSASSANSPPPLPPPSRPTPPPPPRVRPPSVRIPPQQRPPRDFSIPPPQTPQTPASADSAYLKAIGRMAPLGRTGIRTTLCPDMCTLLPPDIRGMSEVAELLWNALVKPATVHEAYIPTVGRLSALHFCIVGAEGTGKRTALRMACASCCVDMLTISPQWYAPDDLCYAVLYACAERPCIVYFDDIEALMKIPVFKHDFDLHVLGQDELCSTWNQVWLAFGALSESDVRTTPVLPLCGMRIAAVVEMQDREAAEMLVNKFLCVGNVRVEPPLTDAQWGELAMAARGCTPRDLRDFAGAVMYHAMCRISLRNLAEIYGLHVVSESMERQQNGRRQQQQNRAGFFAATDSNIVDSVLGERGDRRPDGCAAAPGTCGEEGIADSHSGHPGDRGRALEISWELDAESIYYHIDADSSPDGIERRTIWRPRGPDDGDFPQGGNRRRRW